jgi:cold shock CspA family protein
MLMLRPFALTMPGRYGGGEVKRVANGEHPFAHLELVGVAVLHEGQVFFFHFEQGKVGGRDRCR